MVLENNLAPEGRVARTLEIFGGSPHSWREEWSPELGRLIRTAIAIVPGGCYWARIMNHDGPPRGCSFCNFEPVIDAVTEGVPYSGADHAAMVARALAEAGEGAERICVFTGGSFAPRDIEIDGLVGMARLASNHPGAKILLVESRPELITAELIAAVRGALRPDQMLEVAIGFETQNDKIRNGKPGEGLNKGITREVFERGISLIGEGGGLPSAYVMLKPYEGMGEAEGLDECLETMRYVFGAGVAKAILQVTFPQESAKELTAAWRRGEWRPARLWSVIEVLRAGATLGPVTLGQFDDIPPPLELPANCESCSPEFYRILEQYRRTLSPGVFDQLPACPCRVAWEREALRRTAA